MSTEVNGESRSFTALASDFSGLRDPKCRLCPLSKTTSRVCIVGNAPTLSLQPNMRLCIVGEAPGAREEQTSQLFSGTAGQLLWEELSHYGLNREHFLVTNAVKCRPQDNETPSNKDITTCARAYLDQELAIFKPQFGLLLGNSALRAVLGKTGITKYNGKKVEVGDTTWVPCVHPAAVLRNPRYARQLKLALLQFKRLVYGEQGQPVTEAVLVNDVDSLRRLLDDLSEAKFGAIDTETWSEHPGHGRFKGGGLAWWDDTFRVAAVCITVKPGTGYVVPLWHEKARWKDPWQVVRVLKSAIERVPKWVMQNGQYDLHTLSRLDIHPYMAFDTMGAQYAIDENSLKDLGLLATEYLGAEDYKDTLDKSKMNKAPLKDLAEYGARDSDYTYRLSIVLNRRLKQDSLSYRLFQRLLMPATRTLASIEEAGLPVDRDKFYGRRTVCRDNIDASIERIESLAGSKINPRSPVQLAKILYKDLGFPVVELTATGNPSTSEAALIKLADYDVDEGIVDAILEFRHWDGYNSRYFSSWQDLMDKDGRLHAHFKPFHTVTGRLSCENPNLQQVPRDQFIRGIVGGVPGWKIVEADYSQVELRIAAHITQDKAMLRAFNTGRDIHMETAMAVTGKLESEISKEDRKRAKSVNFGFLYGMGWKTYIDYAKTHYGIDVADQEAKFVRERFFSTFRSLESWHDRQRRKVKEHKFVISPIGRKRRLWDVDSDNQSVAKEAERQAINSPVQSMASDMMLFSMVLLHPQLDPAKARIISTVHDSLLFEIREDSLSEVIPTIRQTMENLPLEDVFDTVLTVPIEVEIKVGSYWSEGSQVVT